MHYDTNGVNQAEIFVWNNCQNRKKYIHPSVPTLKKRIFGTGFLNIISIHR